MPIWYDNNTFEKKYNRNNNNITVLHKLAFIEKTFIEN